MVCLNIRFALNIINTWILATAFKTILYKRNVTMPKREVCKKKLKKRKKGVSQSVNHTIKLERSL